MKKCLKDLAPVSGSSLIGPGVRRISGLQNLEVRFGSWNVESFRGKGTEVCEQLKKKESGYILSAGSKMECERISICWYQR